MRIDPAGLPFVAIAASPAIVAAALTAPAGLTLSLLVLPIAIGLFFRDPDRDPPQERGIVLAPADGKVMFAGEAQPAEAPEGRWRQVTIFLSPLDVHINRTPVPGRVLNVKYVRGGRVAAYRPEAHGNEHSEIWLEHDGVVVVTRQVVGLLARRVVCRVKPGDTLEPGARIGLMKFGSRMDVFVPLTATLTVRRDEHVRGGETVIARLASGGS